MFPEKPKWQAKGKLQAFLSTLLGSYLSMCMLATLFNGHPWLTLVTLVLTILFFIAAYDSFCKLEEKNNGDPPI